mmetsp:Transcript_48680/g.146723  ORF Transcript_48680/g.146723 Transcript_48680/m.146723 type:complete len:243 (-) Transcript_48680:960-1688(-)
MKRIYPIFATLLLSQRFGSSKRSKRVRRSLATVSELSSSPLFLSCPDPTAPLILSDFENGMGIGFPTAWYANQYRSYASKPSGAPQEHVFGHGDGRYANFHSRTAEWNGPTHQLDWRCVDVVATYEFKARVRLDAPEGTTSSCQSNLSKCVHVALSLEDASPSNADDDALNIHNWMWLGGQSKPSVDGVWFDLEFTFQFDMAVTDSSKLGGAGIVRREIYLEGPESWIDIGLDDVTLSRVVE